MKKLLIVVLLLTSCASNPAVRRQQIALNVAMVIDMESTFAGLEKCGGCREGNPLLAGPVDRGRLLTYALQLGLNAFVVHMAERAKDRPRSFWKYLPWSLAAGHGIAAALNLRLLMQEESDVVIPPVPLDEVAHAGRD